MMHAWLHLPQPMHFSATRSTPPPSRTLRAPSGQALAHGGSGQARQVMTTNCDSTPPWTCTWTALLFGENELCTILAHANMHEKQPMHRSMSKTRIVFDI